MSNEVIAASVGAIVSAALTVVGIGLFAGRQGEFEETRKSCMDIATGWHAIADKSIGGNLYTGTTLDNPELFAMREKFSWRLASLREPDGKAHEILQKMRYQAASRYNIWAHAGNFKEGEKLREPEQCAKDFNKESAKLALDLARACSQQFSGIWALASYILTGPRSDLGSNDYGLVGIATPADCERK